MCACVCARKFVLFECAFGDIDFSAHFELQILASNFCSDIELQILAFNFGFGHFAFLVLTPKFWFLL